jgi:hypothetical protein
MIEPALRDAVYFAGGALRGGTLDEDTDVDGVPCKGGEKIQLHENGRLESAWLAADVTVGGVPCAAGEVVDFYPSGALRWARLARDTVVDGVPCKGGELLELYGNGRLESAWLAADVTVGGVPCAADAPVDCYPSGALKWARLARPHRVGEVPCAQGSPTFFHPNGVLWNGELGDRWRRDGRVYHAGTRVTLDPTGRVLEWSSKVPPGGVVEGLPCRSDFDVWRYPDGRLSNVVLANPAVIDDVTYAANTEVDLDEQGHVVHAVVVRLEEGVRYQRRVYGRIVPGQATASPQ